METRKLGKTGESFPILSFGAQRIVDEEGCNEDQAVETLAQAQAGGENGVESGVQSRFVGQACHAVPPCDYSSASFILSRALR